MASNTLSRRSVLQVGGASLLGLGLPDMLRAESTSEAGRRKSLILVYLSGGLSHHETFDPKPSAPAEVRGEFGTIPTALPGYRVGEHLPLLARSMDKISVVRSLVGQVDEHSSFQSLTGTTERLTKQDGVANFGSIVAKIQGPAHPLIPAYVDLFPVMQHKPYNTPGPGRLGRGFAGVKVDGQEAAAMRSLAVASDRVGDRRELLRAMDGMRRSGPASGDGFHERAFEILTSNDLVRALDVEREPVSTRDRYGRGSAKHLGDGAPLFNDQLLAARRLVEAGARVVTVAYGFWDTHSNNFSHLKKHLPAFDRGISALVEDIHQRGLQDEVSVLVWGEFGRTPKINKEAGRDHWSRVNFALFAGAGIKPGRVIGQTDLVGGTVKDDPVPYRSVLASAYLNLGIEPHAMVTDVGGRPTPILDSGVQPVPRLHG
jgi:hypothetical protein